MARNSLEYVLMSDKIIEQWLSGISTAEYDGLSCEATLGFAQLRYTFVRWRDCPDPKDDILTKRVCINVTIMETGEEIFYMVVDGRKIYPNDMRLCELVSFMSKWREQSYYELYVLKEVMPRLNPPVWMSLSMSSKLFCSNLIIK